MCYSPVKRATDILNLADVRVQQGNLVAAKILIAAASETIGTLERGQYPLGDVEKRIKSLRHQLRSVVVPDTVHDSYGK